MFGSLDFGRVLGIPIRVSVLFLVLVFTAAVHSAAQRPEALGLLAALILSLFAHELAHALVARRLGIQVIDITFMPHAGMARMRGLPEDPKVEARVALAGPGANLVLAAVSWPLALVPPSGGPVANFGSAMVVVNLFLGLMNLVPAFPMDGGRVLRSFLAQRRGWYAATEQAVATGRTMALALGFFGLLRVFSGTNVWLGFSAMLIAFFVWLEGTKELWRVRLRWSGNPLGGLFGGNGPGGGFGGPSEPERTPAFDEAPSPRKPRQSEATKGSSPEPDAGPRRPQQWDFELDAEEPAAGSRRIDDEALRRLEAYRGPLRRPSQPD